jgi:predicted metal-dependent hydrolase
MKQQIEIDGIKMQVERKNIKNMYIRILPPNGEVKITVPKLISDEKVRLFILSRIAWIKKNKAKCIGNPPPAKENYVSGEIHYLWGKAYRLEVFYTNGKSNVYIKEDNIVLEVQKNSTQAQREDIIREWYRKELKKEIPKLLERCVKVVGKSPNEWRVKNMRTRWGTCNINKKRIWLNLQLAKKPIECLEYVITHELVHLYEKGHNAKFRAYMDQFYPNWRSVKKQLLIY